MSRQTRGSVYKTKAGFGIRWPEGGSRQHQDGFKTKKQARDWFDEHVGPRLRRRGPSAEITLVEFTAVYLDRWGPTVSERTRRTLERDWLVPAIKQFGSFTLYELEGAAEDIARWRASLPSEDRRYKATRALRQVLAAAVRWGYISRNAALVAGSNPQPRGEEINPFGKDEIDRIAEEMVPKDAAVVVFAAETGLRTNEWIATERRDIDRRNPAVAVARRFSKGQPTPYPKTERRRVPLTPRAAEALSWVPTRLDTTLLFCSPDGHHIHLDNFRLRIWYPALEAAGLEKRGMYQLRHSFASEALAAGVSVFELSRLMGASVDIIMRHYGHLVRDSEDHLRGLLSTRHDLRSSGDEMATGDQGES